MLTSQKNFTMVLLSLLLFTGIRVHAAETGRSPYEYVPAFDVAAYALGAGAFTASRFINSGVPSPSAADIMLFNRGSVNGFDRGATFNWSPGANTASNVLYVTALAAPLVLCSPFIMSDSWGEYLKLSVMFSEAILLNFGVNSLVKTATLRKRPYLYDTALTPEFRAAFAAKEKDSQQSFYSNHTSTVFCAAVFFSKVVSDYEKSPFIRCAVWGTALSLAGTTGYLRYAAGKHFTTDIITGAAVGSVIGYLVPLAHEKKAGDVAVLPYAGGQTGVMFVIVI